MVEILKYGFLILNYLILKEFLVYIHQIEKLFNYKIYKKELIYLNKIN